MWYSIRKFRGPILVSFIVIIYVHHKIQPQCHNVRNNGLREFSSYRPPIIRWDEGRFDKRKILKIYDRVWVGTKWDNMTKNMSVCLATQTSIDRIHPISEVVGNWLGPISLAVYISTVNEWRVLNYFVQYVQRCNFVFSNVVSIHLVINSSSPEIQDLTSSGNSINLTIFQLLDYPCGEPKKFLTAAMSRFMPGGFDRSIPYPQNHMRNIARKNCRTPWVMMTDVDIIPSYNAAILLHQFYLREGSKCLKCAFVIPTFELDISLPYPKTKMELISYFLKGQARQFRVKFYANGHMATNYFLWTTSNLLEDNIKVSHLSSTLRRLNYYEPFYISSDDIPSHRERFLGYGCTRISQARSTGWTFKVLTPVFAIHWGLNEPENSHHRTPRKSQHSNNYFIFREFVSELGNTTEQDRIEDSLKSPLLTLN